MNREEIVEYVAQLARNGYLDSDSIVEAVFETEETDVPEDDVAAIVAGAIAQRRAELANAPRPSAYERLMKVFAQLESKRVLARDNYWCCQTCAYAAIDEEIAGETEKGSPPRGYVLFHNQDTDRAAEAGMLCLRYGGVTANPETEGPAATTQIGWEIVAELKAARFDPQWNGSPNEVIYLPIDWDKVPPA